MILGPRRFLADEEPYGRAVLCTGRDEAQEFMMHHVRACVHHPGGGLHRYCSELPRNSGKKTVSLNSQAISLTQSRCQVGCRRAPVYRSKIWLTVTFLSSFLLLPPPFRSEGLSGKGICFS